MRDSAHHSPGYDSIMTACTISPGVDKDVTEQRNITDVFAFVLCVTAVIISEERVSHLLDEPHRLKMGS